MTYGCQTWSLTTALVKKLETSQRSMERKMLNVKLKDRIRNIINRQRTRTEVDAIDIAGLSLIWIFKYVTVLPG